MCVGLNTGFVVLLALYTPRWKQRVTIGLRLVYSVANEKHCAGSPSLLQQLAIQLH